MQKTPSPAAKLLNIGLLVSFLATILVPLTGLVIHKLSSVLFLLLCVIHTLVYRRRLKKKSILLLALVLVCFLSGLLGMIWEQFPILLALHRVLSIGCTAALAIHIFIFHRRLR